MFDTEIPARREVKNRHFFIYMTGVYLALSLLHAALYFFSPNFDRGWNLVQSILWICICIRNYRITIDEPERTKILDI